MSDAEDLPAAGNANKILSMEPAGAGWFVVTLDRIEGLVMLDRAVALTVIEGDDGQDRVVGVGADGIPYSDLARFGSYLVRGGDQSPSGRTWETVFNSHTPNRHMWRHVTNEFRELF